MNRRRTGAAKAAIAKKKTDALNSSWQKEPIPTAGERLPDGSLIELVRDSSDATKAMLLHHDGKSAFISDRAYSSDNNVFVPAITESRSSAPAAVARQRFTLRTNAGVGQQSFLDPRGSFGGGG